MKKSFFGGLVLVVAVLCCGSVAQAQKRKAAPAPSVAGIYEDFTVGKGSGDLEGMRVMLFSAGSGYHAVVQIAQGGAEDPEPTFVTATVKGSSVQFTVGDVTYKGTVSAAGLKLTPEGGTTEVLKRTPCSGTF